MLTGGQSHHPFGVAGRGACGLWLAMVSALGPVCAAPGDLDATFGQGGTTTVSIPGTSTSESGNAIALQTDGKAIIVGTADSKIAIMRMNQDGSLDTSFGFGGKVASGVGYEGDAVAVLGDGKLIIAGTASVSAMANA